jgi:drug/metabolite transporter (DMT)-like permease
MLRLFVGAMGTACFALATACAAAIPTILPHLGWAPPLMGTIALLAFALTMVVGWIVGSFLLLTAIRPVPRAKAQRLR